MTWWRITTALAGALLTLTLEVETAEARPRLAFLTLSAPQEGAQLIDAFVDGLRRLGYVEGRNVDVDYRYAAGDVGRLEPLAQELTALHPDVLVGSEPSAARAFKNVAPTLPIVSMALTDALIPELIASYARPGGNVTGIASSVEGLTGKLVELALEVIPGAARLGFLSNPAGASMRLFAQSVDTASRGRGIAVLT
jgi:putative ABC transport system substrate-binding protein